MFNREDVERVLAVNGVPPSAPEEEIKSVLISANWHQDDVEAAVLVMRENKDTHKTRVDKLHKVFYTDERLRPETVSSLLGIETQFTPSELDRRSTRQANGLTAGQMLKILIISIACSLALILAMMWYLHAGIFYPIAA